MARAKTPDAPVAIVGAGVVGAAVAHALARRGVEAVLLEAEPEPGLAASGTNSGILHTGFDSAPGDLETRLLIRSGELRDAVLDELDIPVLRCGAAMLTDRETARPIAEAAERNGIDVRVDPEGRLEIPGEAVTDPVAYTLALAGTADVRTSARVEAIERREGLLDLGLADGARLSCRVAVNCAGLYADEVARMAGDSSFEIYPRKGEFFVFDPPGGRPLDRILLPVPTKRTKGVLVFPTIDGKVVAGPTAHDGEDKSDWSVRPEAQGEVLSKAQAMFPPIEGAEPVAAYAGLRPAGRGVNYAIGHSPACPGLVNAAAIRSTGLSASLGIAEHVLGLIEELGVELGPDRAVRAAAPPSREPWWLRTARHRGVPA
jgi:glycerol-3-phosphate dehydrogenase